MPTFANKVCATNVGASRIHSADDRVDLYFTDLFQLQWPAFFSEIFHLLADAWLIRTVMSSPGLTVQFRSPGHPLNRVSEFGNNSFQA